MTAHDGRPVREPIYVDVVYASGRPASDEAGRSEELFQVTHQRR